jgi:arsenite methyltransferase
MSQENVKEAVKQEAGVSACCGGDVVDESKIGNAEQIKEMVKERYGAAARIAAAGGRAACGPVAPANSRGCCSGSSVDAVDPITKDLYDASQRSGLPQEAVLASLGCGNPTALAQLSPGETVLDLGSGGGIDVLLSARRVGPTGKAYGLDMTDDMLALARENQRKAGVTNVEFLKGAIEEIPLPDNSVDVIISNCVINLSADKDRVLREAFRVLKPGGRFAVSDIVVRGEVAPEIRRNVELWIGCVAGALEENEYREKLARAGFMDVDVEPTRIYKVEDAREFLNAAGISPDAIAPHVDGKFMSAFVRARKPVQDTRENRTASSVQVYDPAMCCSTGVCGPSMDTALPRFAADLDWLAAQGVRVERFNLAQQPATFVANKLVKAALAAEGTKCLPIILVNGSMVSKGAYPKREELARWAGVNGDLTGSK